MPKFTAKVRTSCDFEVYNICHLKHWITVQQYIFYQARQQFGYSKDTGRIATQMVAIKAYFIKSSLILGKQKKSGPFIKNVKNNIENRSVVFS